MLRSSKMHCLKRKPSVGSHHNILLTSEVFYFASTVHNQNLAILPLKKKSPKKSESWELGAVRCSWGTAHTEGRKCDTMCPSLLTFPPCRRFSSDTFCGFSEGYYCLRMWSRIEIAPRCLSPSALVLVFFSARGEFFQVLSLIPPQIYLFFFYV